ncbi:Haloacetate dehalogenase H-2 [Hartmannibacter diazotrophicus]|uniref:(S)-2-haloacid dehalogenase n=1 Tax=Hartmannibacter diazotrophicus TaxID=1482074 RepID=A0A2C9DA42_9HYPH|nr:haloacid dehalogenase type II [Hartmannibacter diazotrophicus]SON56611.1 Haloacetate dehalogenase H-2 [Hartmannibacter diazotrophicus]
MQPSRRDVVATTLALAVSSTGLAAKARAATSPIRAVAFDGFPVFDPRGIFAMSEETYPGKGDALNALWRSRQFEYTWLRSLGGMPYRDFPAVIEDALVFATSSLGLPLSGETRDRMVGGFFAMPVWPDVKPALRAMRGAGLRLAFLNNFSRKMLAENVRYNGLEEDFEFQLSVDAVGRYKPAPEAYQMGPDAFGLPKEQIAFAAFAGWDAAGAKAFGFPTFWVNRMKQKPEELGFAADATGSTLGDLADHLSARG